MFEGDTPVKLHPLDVRRGTLAFIEEVDVAYESFIVNPKKALDTTGLTPVAIIPMRVNSFNM